MYFKLLYLWIKLYREYKLQLVLICANISSLES